MDFSAEDEVTKRFVTDFREKTGNDPTAYNANYYNAVRLFGLLAAAVEEKGEDVTGPNLLAERQATKTFDFVGGKVTFLDNGTVVAPIQINRIENGAGVPIDTVDVAN